jgi:hypothetical protein
MGHLPPIPHPSPPITVGHTSSLWRGSVVAHLPDPNPHPWGGERSSPPSPPFSSPIHGLPADPQCLGGGAISVRGMGYHAPTPQAGKVADSDGGGKVRVGGGGCERSSATLSNRQFIQKRRGGTSNLQ